MEIEEIWWKIWYLGWWSRNPTEMDQIRPQSVAGHGFCLAATSEGSHWHGHSPVSAIKTWGNFAVLLSSSFVSTGLLGNHGINYRIQLPLVQSRINDTQQDLGSMWLVWLKTGHPIYPLVARGWEKHVPHIFGCSIRVECSITIN